MTAVTTRSVAFVVIGSTSFVGLSVLGLRGLPTTVPTFGTWWLYSSVEFSVLLLATLVSELGLGLIVGWLTAYGPRGLHVFLQRCSELLGALPLFAYLAVLRLATGGEPFAAFLSVICVARILYGAERTRLTLLELESSTFAIASRALGSSRRQRFAHHFFPHVVATNLSQALQLPAFLVGVEACLALVGANANWPSWGAALVQGDEPLLSSRRLVALGSLIATGAWTSHAASILTGLAEKRLARVGLAPPVTRAAS